MISAFRPNCCALCASAGLATAGFTVSEATLSQSAMDSLNLRNPAGDAYFQVAGLGGAGGFAFSTLGAVEDTFDGAGQNIGTDLIAGTHDGLAETDVSGDTPVERAG